MLLWTFANDCQDNKLYLTLFLTEIVNFEQSRKCIYVEFGVDKLWGTQSGQ